MKYFEVRFLKRRSTPGGPQFFFPPTAKKRRVTFFCLRRKMMRAPKSRVALESRVALRATSLAVAVAQNGYFDPNVAPAQQRNS